MKYAGMYSDMFGTKEDERIYKKYIKIVPTREFLEKDEFIELCGWKSPRVLGYCRENSNEEVKEVTFLSFSTKIEKVRVGCLRALNGVDFPIASVFLHFRFPNRYSILDFRAMWSLGKEKSHYSFNFWLEYHEQIRNLAGRMNLTIREIDKALWMFSNVNQRQTKRTQTLL